MQEWPVWRLVMAKKATLEDIENRWSLDDVMRANALMDYEADLPLVQPKPKEGRK